jgi:HKD family nuclease
VLYVTDEFKGINTLDYAAIDGIAAKEIDTINCITGDNNHLIKKLDEAFVKAKKVGIIVAFLMESGVKLLEENLKALVERNIPGTNGVRHHLSHLSIRPIFLVEFKNI